MDKRGQDALNEVLEAKGLEEETCSGGCCYDLVEYPVFEKDEDCIVELQGLINAHALLLENIDKLVGEYGQVYNFILNKKIDYEHSLDLIEDTTMKDYGDFIRDLKELREDNNE